MKHTTEAKKKTRLELTREWVPGFRKYCQERADEHAEKHAHAATAAALCYVAKQVADLADTHADMEPAELIDLAVGIILSSAGEVD